MSAAVRTTPALGGFNLTALGLEIRRVLRNRRTAMFVVVFPSIFFFMFRTAGARDGGNAAMVQAYVLISMAVYGAMVGTTAGGASVAVERSLGWSRHLRLTPLRPSAYVAMKIITAMMLGLVAIATEFAVGAIAGVRMPAEIWLMSGVSAWLCSMVFAAFGLFVGFLFPSENVMQIVGPLLAVMAMFGGLFVPLQMLPHGIQVAARFTPVYGVGVIARAPLVGGFTSAALGSVLGWTAAFGFGAMRLFRRDTARV